MSQGSTRQYARAIGVWIAAIALSAAIPCRAQDGGRTDAAMLLHHDVARELFARPYRLRHVGWSAPPDPRRELVTRRGGRLDLSPLAEGLLTLVRDQGLPLHAQRDEKGGGPIGVMAAFDVGADVPAVSFHLGDRPVEPLGAFYAPVRGFRAALVWPIERFTLRLEGGEDSELGYYGIAGLQWLHPRQHLAIGAGIPMNLRDTDGDVGLVLQLRLRLD